MNKNYALLAVLCTSLFKFNAQAQSELYAGVKHYPEVVETPYIHKDLFRDQHPEFWYEAEGSSPGSWIRSQHVISRKNAGNRFDLLTRRLWNDQEARYDTLHNYQYTYKADGLGRQTEIELHASIGGGSGAQNKYRQKYLYTYAGNRLTEVKRQDATTGAFTDISTLHVSYDAQGNRIKDSVYFPTDPTVRVLTLYAYNTENKCVSKADIFGPDTTQYRTFIYSNNRLAVLQEYVRDVSDEPFEKIYQVEYKYHGDGTVNLVLVSYAFDPTPLEPVSLYQHYYNSQKKLTAMVESTWNQNIADWSRADSVAIRLNANGSADTSYGYRPSTSGDWDPIPSARYIFPVGPSTGLKGNTALNEIPITLYPNPAADVVHIDLGKPVTSAAKVTVTDITGKVIDRLHVISGGSTLNVFSDQWETGVYFMLVETTEGKGMSKVVISR